MLSHQFNLLLPPTQSALLAGILLGDQSSLPKDFAQALKNTSTVHMVVASGQNLSLVAAFLMAFVSIFGRKLTILLASIMVLCYAGLTGWQIPITRALIMVELTFFAQLVGREAKTIWILLISALVMIAASPSIISSISFQLSFLATFAVVVVSPVFARWLSKMPELIRQDLAVSLAAQALTWPIIAANFHQTSTWGFLINLFVLWTIPLIMILGSIVLLLSFLFLPLAQIVAILPNIMLTYFIDIVRLGDKLPGLTMQTGEVNSLIVVGYYLVVAGGVMALRKRG